MSNKFDSLILVIESLKQETDWVGYIFQAGITVFTFLLGLLVAYITFKWQKKHEVAKNKIDESNKYTGTPIEFYLVSLLLYLCYKTP